VARPIPLEVPVIKTVFAISILLKLFEVSGMRIKSGTATTYLQ
jgi:hypothetical protein